MKLLKRTWADVSLDNLAHNYTVLRRQVPAACRFLGVVKADAYGHGAVPVSHHLEELGAEFLAVSNLEEAVQLRRAEVRRPILILGYTPAQYARELAGHCTLICRYAGAEGDVVFLPCHTAKMGQLFIQGELSEKHTSHTGRKRNRNLAYSRQQSGHTSLRTPIYAGTGDGIEN